MRQRTSEPESDSFTTSVRYAMLVLIFCVVSAVELVHAKFALLTLSELHAYWLGRAGYFPFEVLPWSDRHFGGDALAMRLPLLVVFAVMLTLVLLGLDRMVLRKVPAMTLTLVAVAALFALGVQQFFALKEIRAERRALFELRDRVERATAPGEELVAGENVLLPFYEYGSEGLRQELRSEINLSSAGALPVPVTSAVAQGVEFVFVGSEDEPFARKSHAAGYVFHKEKPAQPDTSGLVARYYRTAGASTYFVSPPAKDVPAAVSSKP